MEKFIKKGGSWVAYHRNLTVKLSGKCMSVTHSENGIEAILRFQEVIENISTAEFFYSPNQQRAAIILPTELGHLEVVDIGMSLVVRNFNNQGALLQTVTAQF
mgnify:CR=1 FL=1